MHKDQETGLPALAAAGQYLYFSCIPLWRAEMVLFVGRAFGCARFRQASWNMLNSAHASRAGRPGLHSGRRL